MRTVLALLAASFAISAQGAPCAAHSGFGTAALVELYTSEGCPGCPGAERWLSALASREPVVAVAIPVDGVNARRDAWLRQRKLTHLQRLALVSRPQVLLQGRESGPWQSPAFEAALAAIRARPARASLALEITQVRGDSLTVRAAARRGGGDLELYLAAYETEARTELKRVLEWRGPFALSTSRPALERTLPIPAGVLTAGSGVVGFVQIRGNSEVLQALMLPACP